MKSFLLLLTIPLQTTSIIHKPLQSKYRTRFVFRQPTKENILSILFGREDVDDDGFVPQFNHDSIGITDTISQQNDSNQYHLQKTIIDSQVIDGWRVLSFRQRIGHGRKCYERIRKAVLDWSFESKVGKRRMGILRVEDPNIKTKGLLATFTEIQFPKSLFVANPVHVVHERKDVKYNENCIFSSTAYATLRGHLLSGEERVTVFWRNGREVDVEILSCSRAAPSLTGKIIWPFIGRMQQQFFQAEMEHFQVAMK